ncbi:MAG TPA: PAS domain-containing protein, partial [Chloroflexota bacterium]|nr:PAS domain-containing protein [Chloroflexota bacterium]
MTDERNLAETLAASMSADTKTLRTVVDLLPLGVVVSDAQGAITLSNQEVEAVLGAPISGTAFGPDRGYTLNRLDGSLFPPDDLPLPRALKNGETTRDVRILVRSATGAERIMLVAASPIRDDAGQIVGAVAVLQDVTHQQRTVRLL